MGKFGKKVEIQLDPLRYNLGILGESGIGKSTLMKEVCEKLAGDEGYIALNIGREDGHNAINGIISEDIPDWQKFVEVLDDIIENKTTEYPDLKVVIIDTYDELCRLAENEAIRQYNIKNPDKKADSINGAWGGFGHGLARVIEMMLTKLDELKQVGVSYIIIAHVKRTEVTDVTTEETYTMLTSNTTQKYFNAIKQKLDVCGVGYIDRRIVREKTGRKDVTGKDIYRNRATDEARSITFHDPTFSLDSKSRFAEIVDKIPFNSDAFITAIKDAILAEQSKSGVPLADVQKKQKSEDKARAKAAETYSKNHKRSQIDESANEEYIRFIHEHFISAGEEVKAEIKKVMAEYDIKNFKDSAVSTEGLQKIVALLNDAELA